LSNILNYITLHATPPKIFSSDLDTFYCCWGEQYTVSDELHQEFPFSTQHHWE
jgi:hypothetical protein